MAAALSDLELTKVADDPYIHFGDVVQLVHVDTGCVLAGDPADAVRARGRTGPRRRGCATALCGCAAASQDQGGMPLLNYDFYPGTTAELVLGLHAASGAIP